MDTPLTRCAISLGDAAGVGPELVLRMLNCSELASQCQMIVYGNRDLLVRVANACNIPWADDLQVMPYPLPEKPMPKLPRKSHILFDFPFDAGAIIPGKVQAACGQQAYTWLCAAIHDTHDLNIADALVTAPLNKEALHVAGIVAAGHTEILAQKTNATDPRMLFYSSRFCLCLATIHEPIANVPKLLTIPSLTQTLRMTHSACESFGIQNPRIGVLALNPHAGENGLFGQEEHEVITPAIKTVRAEGIHAFGPLVPDTAFTWLGAHPPVQAPYHAYVAMYHDQGLIPFKLAAFDSGVNVTLGLPIIRTSPDHGTAFDLAWQGIASPGSLFSAIKLAIQLAQAHVSS